MPSDDYYRLGHVVKTHGLKGQVQFFLDVDQPQAYRKMESVWVDKDQTLVPFFIERLEMHPKKTIAKIEKIDTVAQAQALVSKALYLPIASLPTLHSGQYYLHQLIGMQLYDGKVLVGEVKAWFEVGSQRLIAVDHQGKEALVPLVDEIILKVDLTRGVIHAQLPAGLVDIYSDSHED